MMLQLKYEIRPYLSCCHGLQSTLYYHGLNKQKYILQHDKYDLSRNESNISYKYKT